MNTLKRTIRLLAVTAIGFGLLAVLFTQLNVVAKAAPTDQLDVCATCTYTTIQTAVNAANPGDTIRGLRSKSTVSYAKEIVRLESRI